jgi:hypothetical protein
MTQRRSMTFDPPLEVPLNDGAVLLVRAARRAARGFSATVQIWNEHLIHADDFAIDQARLRKQFIREACTQYPALNQSVLTQALLKLVAALPPQIDAVPSRHETLPPPPSADAQAAEHARKDLPTIEATEGDLRVITAHA